MKNQKQWSLTLDLKQRLNFKMLEFWIALELTALTSPFTVGLNPPKVDISFGTQTAVGVGEVDASAGSGIVGCQFYANEPEVTITVN